jgi:ech hydrogenase subunit B
MNSLTTSIITALIVLIIAPILGCFLSGLDRKLTAHMQGRVGPSIMQPWYDFIKLLHKENIVVNIYQNIYIVFYFVFVVASLIMLVLNMDFLMIIFVYTIANVSLIVGGMSTGSPYSKIGCERETMAMLAYEPIIIFYILGIYKLTGSFSLANLNSFSKPVIMYLPLIFISMLFIMIIKFKKSPFDFSTSHHAHQELVKGIFTEFSGPAFAIVELTHWYEYVFLLGMMFIFWKQNILFGTLIAAFAYLFVLVADNVSARLSWKWMLKFCWTTLLTLSILNIVFLYLNNIKLV